jgi:hypothetical protein
MNVANRVKPAPQLIILATDAQAVKARFGGWPDLLLPEDVLSQLLDGPGQLAPELQIKLRERGLLQAEGAALRLAIPVYEQLPLEQWQQSIAKVVVPHLAKLQSAVSKLQQDWGTQPGAPAWEKVAHSLLVNYLLWGVGGQMLLKLHGVTAATVIVNKLGDSEAIWQGFVRYNQQYGASCLLGSQYEHSVTVRELLNKQDVVTAMATLTDDRRLTVSEASARRPLSRLSALGGDRADDGTERTTWPVLAAKDLRSAKDSLLAVSKALLPLLKQVVAALADKARPELVMFEQADISLVAYGLLVRIIADDWTEAGLLPSRVQPIVEL